jgi:hypothetical protein
VNVEVAKHQRFAEGEDGNGISREAVYDRSRGRPRRLEMDGPLGRKDYQIRGSYITTAATIRVIWLIDNALAPIKGKLVRPLMKCFNSRSRVA